LHYGFLGDGDDDGMVPKRPIRNHRELKGVIEIHWELKGAIGSQMQLKGNEPLGGIGSCRAQQKAI
jgi:hypothetical protein